MNEIVLAAAGDPVGLTVSIAPWPHAGPADYTAMAAIESRVDSGRAALILHLADPQVPAAPLERLRRLMTEGLPLLRTGGDARMTLDHSGIVLDAAALSAALDEWTETAIPVHSLIAFDFAVPGEPAGARSIGLAALAGQEISARPPSDIHRRACARMVARLAHDMLLYGPILAECVVPAPDMPGGVVTLVPRHAPQPVVEIHF